MDSVAEGSASHGSSHEPCPAAGSPKLCRPRSDGGAPVGSPRVGKPLELLFRAGSVPRRCGRRQPREQELLSHRLIPSAPGGPAGAGNSMENPGIG